MKNKREINKESFCFKRPMTRLGQKIIKMVQWEAQKPSLQPKGNEAVYSL